jgi:hypothetical protein
VNVPLVEVQGHFSERFQTVSISRYTLGLNDQQNACSSAPLELDTPLSDEATARSFFEPIYPRGVEYSEKIEELSRMTVSFPSSSRLIVTNP